MSLKDTILSTKITADQIAFFYLGQVGFIIKFQETYVLIDGYLSDYVDQNCCTDTVKWVRNYPSPIHAEELDFIDLVFCTHAHYDHTDPYTISQIAKTNSKAKFVISKAISNILLDYGVEKSRIVEVVADRDYSVNNMDFRPIPSAHEGFNQNEHGEYSELGFIFRFNGTTVYHSGDCCMYDGLSQRISGTDILILPINGRDYFRNANDIIGCFDSSEALLLAKEAKAKLLIPVHFDLYSVNQVNPAYFVDCHERICKGLPYHIFMPGEKYIY